MKVQRVRFPDSDRVSWLVLDDGYRPVEPIRTFLKFREDLGRSPNTIRADAHHLKLFWEYVRDVRMKWTDVDAAILAGFIPWLRHPVPAVLGGEQRVAERTDATIDQILTAVHEFYDFHARVASVPDLALYRFISMPRRRYKPFLHGIAKSKPLRTRIVKVRREKRLAKTLTRDQAQRLIDACRRVRDKFLVALLYDTGLRIGQALGLRHEDVAIEDGEIRVVPRDNANGAREEK
jgi:integrase/recombinase XerD